MAAEVSEEEQLEREIRQLLSPWQKTLDARLRAGWRDNVRFASESPVASPFVGAGVEGFAARTLGGDMAAEAFGSVDYRRYLDVGEAEDEVVGFAMADWRAGVSGPWTFTAGVEYTYQDQWLDVVEITEKPTLTVAHVKGQALTLRPVLRRGLGSHFWVEAEGRGQRSWYEYNLDDTWEGGGGASAGWSPRGRTEVTLGYGFDQRWYDTDPVRDVWGDTWDGAPARKAARHEVKLAWREKWGGKGAFRTTARMGGRVVRDGYSGYYDYDRWWGDLRARYTRGPWHLEAGVRVAYYEYLLPREILSGEIPPGGSIRMVSPRRTEVASEVEAQRTIWKGAALFVNYAWDDARSNQPGEGYTVHTVSGGLKWSF